MQLDETVTFSHNAVFNVEAGSSNAGINEGDKLSVKDCLYALLLNRPTKRPTPSQNMWPEVRKRLLI